MNTEIFIVTHAKDFPWLKFCLRSIEKFASGFSGVTILVPDKDVDPLTKFALEWGAYSHPGFCIIGGDEWTNAGMNWHMNEIMHADQHCPKADFIAHIDPDCVFTGPVTPETYLQDGKPILRYENFNVIGVRHPGTLRWQECTARCLPFPVHYETMRCHPEVYHRDLYPVARQQVEQKTGQPVADYIRQCRNEFPQGFSEFITLGNVAMQLFREKYHLVEQLNDRVVPDNHLQQFWSHGAMDQPQNIWVKGVQKNIVPLQMLAEFGLT